MSSAFRFNLFWVVVFSATMPLAVIASTHLARKSFERVKLRDQTITVKGYAERPITSDLAQWSATITARSPGMVEAGRQLEASRAAALAFLAERGFSTDSVDLSPVSIGMRYALDANGRATNTIESYVLSQTLSIGSNDVQRVASVARDSSSLVTQGVEISAGTPSYLYTKLEDLKLEMLSEATANGRQRAERLVSASTNRLGALRSASQGVFQITPAHSTEVSNAGMNDTMSIEKVIKAVVTVEYAIE